MIAYILLPERQPFHHSSSSMESLKEAILVAKYVPLVVREAHTVVANYKRAVKFIKNPVSPVN